MSHCRASIRRPSWRAAAAVVAASLALAACGTAGPPPVTYVLGAPVAVEGEGVEPLVGRPVIEVKPVLMPDYLDVSDILVRRADNVVAPSPTGRWGERLSTGFTRALSAALVRRLPGFVVTATPYTDRPAYQVWAEVETFEPRPDGTVALVARWRLRNAAGRDTLAGERVSLTVPSRDRSDAANVAAMSRAVEDFADRIAAGIERLAPTPRARR